MRLIPIAALLATALGGWSLAETPAPPGPPEVPVLKGLVVHEWGVFRVHNDVDLANADMRAVWADLPPFVYGQVSGRDLPKHWRNIEAVDKPVLFFHTPRPAEVELRVDFPGGIPALWWPGTQRPGIHDGVILGEGRPGQPFRSLEWRLRLKEPPENPARVVGKRPVATGHWVETLRAVEADDVFAHVGERRLGYERERFVYYDGLLPRGQWVGVTVEKDRVGVRSQASHAVFDLTAVDGRRPGRIRVARLARLEAGAEVKSLEFAEVEAERWPAEGIKTLAAQLKDAGLYADEAGSLVELWKRDLFGEDGVTLFYRLPQEEYERLLPLTMRPRPEALVRVGLVQHPHCEPDLAERVAALVKGLDADDFAAREQAQRRLEALGRAAFVHLVRLRKGTLPLESQRRVDQLLGKYSAEAALRK